MSFGFFNIEELPTATFEGINTKPDKRLVSCKNCKQYLECKSPQLSYIGEGGKKILIITGSVTRIEDNSENKEHSANYAFLKRHLKKCGIELETDCWYTHAIKCYFKSKTTSTMVSACHNKLIQEIRLLKPEHIVVLDYIAWEVLLDDRLGGRAAYSSFYNWCGEVIPDQCLGTYIHPIFDPSLVREEAERQVNKFLFSWYESMNNILTTLPFPVINADDKIKITEDKKQALQWLEQINQWRSFAFDYETTGIKPYAEGHAITHASFSNGVISYSFPVFTDKEFQDALCKVLQNDSVKIAHNLTFERMWSEVILGTEVNRFIHDTMIMQHCVHNKKPTGLKFLTYAKYGYLGYDSEIDEYIGADTEDVKLYGANAFNRMKLAPSKKVMQYCAMDSLFTYWLYEDLGAILKEKKDRYHAYRFFIDAEHALCQATMNGMRVDVEEMAIQKKKLQDLLLPLYDEIMNHDLVLKKWDGGYRFNPKSDHDVRRVLYGLLKFEVIKRTDKNEPSVDEEALEFYKDRCDLIPPLLEYRRWYKALNTYIKQYETEQTNSELHAFFGLGRVATFRGSCIAEGSLVYVAIGNIEAKIPIEEVCVGDLVYCFNEYGDLYVRKVLKVFNNGKKEVIRIHYSYGSTAHYLDLTSDHLVNIGWTGTDKGIYAKAIDLPFYNSVKISGLLGNSKDCGYIKFNYERMEFLCIEKTVYDLEVEEFHNYIVNEICVHNCNSPNLQNVPVRDKEVRDVIRCLLKPKKGHKLIEYDYKANEVGGAASISGDPNLIKYVTDTSSDMHLDASVDLYMIDKDKVNKALRNVTKGPFIFATFYGSYWKQTAKGVWDGINIKNPEKVYGFDVVKHLRSKGIKTYEHWEEHVKEQEYILWHERFPVYQNWREDTFDFFCKYGYVDYVNGFRYYGPATKNELLNAPIQGPSFHCQLWCFTEVTKELLRRKMESCLICQVHDSIVASVLPGEEDWVDRLIYEYGTRLVKEHYTWIKVPLMIEKAATEVDEPWSMKKDKGYLKGGV